MDPGQVQLSRGLQGLLLGGLVDRDDHVGRDAGPQPLQRDGDRRNHAGVADHQVPVGLGARFVGAAGPDQLDPVAGHGRLRPRAGDAGAAVVDEVDRQLEPIGIPIADGVRPHLRPPVTGEGRLDLLEVERGLVPGARWGNLQLHVVIGERAGAESPQALAAEDQPDHLRGQPARPANLGLPRRGALRGHLGCGLGHGGQVREAGSRHASPCRDWAPELREIVAHAIVLW